MIDNLASPFALVCAIYWAASVGLLLISVTATILQPRLATQRGTRADRPPVSIVLPVKLLEQGFERAEESALAQNYPGFEVIAAAVDTTSPAAEAIRAVFARFPHDPSGLLSSTAKFCADLSRYDVATHGRGNWITAGCSFATIKAARQCSSRSRVRGRGHFPAPCAPRSPAPDRDNRRSPSAPASVR